MDPKNICVRMPNWMGDLVMATPVLLELRKKFPGAKLTAMCKAPLGSLLQEEKAVDSVMDFTRPKTRKETRAIIDTLSKAKYDLGILLTNSFSSAWWFWRAKIPVRIGYGAFLRSFFLTQALRGPDKNTHQVERYLQLLDFPAAAPKVVVLEAEKENALQRLLQLGYRKGDVLIGMNPGAAYGSAKCWPKERFQALAQKLADMGFFVAFFGDAAGESMVQEICENLPSCVMNFCGKTSVRELAALISLCTVFVTNDSGPMHIGAALDIPMVALFGSTDDRATGPYGKKESVIHKRVFCSPCFKRECPIDFRCMKQILVAEVLEKILEYIYTRIPCSEPSKKCSSPILTIGC